MAIAFPGSTIAEVAAATSLVCPTPAGAAVGEIMLAVVTVGVSNAPPVPAEWTLVDRSTYNTTPTVVMWRVTTASEPASYTFTSGASGRITASIHRVSGVDPASPFDATPVNVSTTATTSFTTPSITTVTADAVVVYDVSVQTTASTVTANFTPAPTVLTNTGGSSGRRQQVSYELRPTAGATGTRNWTISSSLPATNVTLALRPSAGTTPPITASGSLAITGSGSLTLSGGPSAPVAASGSLATAGSGSLALSGKLATSGAVALAGSSSLTLSGSASAVGVGSLATAGSGSLALSGSAVFPAPALTQRVVGIPTSTSVTVATKTTNATSVRLKVSTDAAGTAGVIFGPAVTPSALGDSDLTASGLTAGTAYYYRVGMTNGGGVESFDTGTVGKFRAAPVGQASFAFNFGSCTNATDSAAMAAIAASGDDLFFHLGDLYYADGSGTDLANIRSKMSAKITAPNHAAVFATTPTTYTPSDHDGMTNNTTAGSDATSWANWNTVYREQLPFTDTYRTFTWGRVRFIQLDTRSFSSSAAATDNASKTHLGTVQKQWLKDTITNSAEKVIVILQADPWIVPTTAGDDGWAGFNTERTELASFFSAQQAAGKAITLLAGDMHALAADDGTNAPGGIHVFHAAPLNNTASQKGGPYTVGPYPATGSATVQQYGRCVVTDTGNQITLAYTGYSSDNTARVSLTRTVSLAASGTLGTSGSGSLALSGRATAGGAVTLAASGSLALSGRAATGGSLALGSVGTLVFGQRTIAAGSLGLAGNGTLSLTGTAREVRWFYRALRPIFLGVGAAIVRAYNAQDVVPDSAVVGQNLTNDVTRQSTSVIN